MQQTTLNNRYRLDAKVGEGGMAAVYRGYDLMLRRQVAIKVLREQFAADSDFIARFEHEAQAAAKLSHPNIVNTYDAGETDGKPFIVQEYVQGETLADLIARQGRLPEGVAVRYARQICGALAAAHRNELLHRDIKPSNILITPEDVVRVTDFGIARLSPTQTASDDDVLGSVGYCAPEQLTGNELTESTDLYALGVVLYEMVTGKRPFDDRSAAAVALAQVNEPVPDPDRVEGVHVSPELRSVIRRLLQKLPGDRFQSAAETLAALRRCATDEAAHEERQPSGPDSPTVVLRRRSAAVGDMPRKRAGHVFDGTPHWRARRAVASAAIVAAIVALLAIAFVEQQALSHGMRVPDLAGKPLGDAALALQTLGINVGTIGYRTDASVPIGLVVATDPAAGASISRSDKVSIYLSGGPPTIAVPNVVGQEMKLAMDMLTAGGFTPRIGSAEHSDTIRLGAVAATRPSAGDQIAQHGTIVLIPSAGPRLVGVPNLVAMLDADATKMLARLGLKLRVNQVIADASIPPHMVIDQDPPAGSQARPGTTVVVDVSGGAATIAVPNVIGGTLDDARNVLAQAGLSVGTIAQAAVADTTPGTVVSQNPAAGAPASQGQAVDLVVAVAPSGVTTASPQPTPTASAAPGAPPATPKKGRR